MVCLLPNARSLRTSIFQDLVVFDETCAIARAILVTDQAGGLEVTVCDTALTTFGSTLSEEYFKNWKGIASPADRLFTLQMNTILDCFTAEKYCIIRKTDNKINVGTALVNIPGIGYVPNDVLTLLPGDGDVVTDGVLTVATTQIISVIINVAGTGYAIDDIITLSNGLGTAATFRVTAETGGVVDSLSIETNGSYTTNPALINEVTTTSAIGIDLTVDVVIGVETVTITDAGLYLIFPTNSPLGITGGTGSAATFDLTPGVAVGNTFCWNILW